MKKIINALEEEPNQISKYKTQQLKLWPNVEHYSLSNKTTTEKQSENKNNDEATSK